MLWPQFQNRAAPPVRLVILMGLRKRQFLWNYMAMGAPCATRKPVDPGTGTVTTRSSVAVIQSCCLCYLLSHKNGGGNEPQGCSGLSLIKRYFNLSESLFSHLEDGHNNTYFEAYCEG